MSGAESAMRLLLRRAPVIPVYTPASVQEAVQVGAALLRGGLPVVEVTLRTPAALAAIRAMVAQVPGLLVGAGTVLTAAQVESVQAAGAAFAVSPGATPALLAAASDAGMPFLPGVATASELMQAMDAGMDCLKLFPAAQVGGTALLQAWAGPFPQLRFCPTGGITPENTADYLRLPNVSCVGGSWLTPRALLDAGDWAGVEALARAAVERHP